MIWISQSALKSASKLADQVAENDSVIFRGPGPREDLAVDEFGADLPPFTPRGQVVAQGAPYARS